MSYGIPDGIAGEFMDRNTHRYAVNTAEGTKYDSTILRKETNMWKMFYFIFNIITIYLRATYSVIPEKLTVSRLLEILCDL
jgi:hypothetical protein